MLAQGTAELFLKGNQGPGNAQAHGAALAAHAAAIGGNDHVPLLIRTGDGERLLDNHLTNGIGEVVGEGAAIDGALTGTWAKNHTGDRILAASGGLNLGAIGILRSDDWPPRCFLIRNGIQSGLVSQIRLRKARAFERHEDASRPGK